MAKNLTVRSTMLLGQAMLAKYNLTTWRFGIDVARRRAGVCRYHDKTITVSRRFIELNTDEEVVGTILHEIAHAIAGSAAGHGPIWQAVAKGLGAAPERCCIHGTFPEGEWKATCPQCGGGVQVPSEAPY